MVINEGGGWRLNFNFHSHQRTGRESFPHLEIRFDSLNTKHDVFSLWALEALS